MASFPVTEREGLRTGPAIGKPPELEDSLNLHLFHPLSRRIARALAPTPVTPNAVSVTGFVLVLAAGLAYTGLDWPLSVLVGFALHAFWHVVDGADGDLARLTGRTSPIGELVDGVCDYAGHVALYILLAAFLDDRIGGWAWAIASLAGVSRILQSNHAESQRRMYLWRAYGVPWLRQTESSEASALRRETVFTRVFGPMARGYLALAEAMSPHAAAVDRAMATAFERRRRLRGVYREASRTVLFLQRALGANPRTVLLGLSMAFGTPLYFFIAECTLFNLLLLLSVRWQNDLNQRMEAIARRWAA